MLTHSQNIRSQKQRINTGLIFYGYLIIYLQNILFPSTNSALSKLNVFPQGRSTVARIHRLGPTGLDPRLAMVTSLCAGKMSTQGTHRCLLWSLSQLFLNGTKPMTFKSVRFLCLFSPRLCILSKAGVRAYHAPAGRGFLFHLE